MKDWIKIREILKNIQNRQNKNQAIYLVGMVDLLSLIHI